MNTRLLIQESIPRMSRPVVVSHDLMTEFFSAPVPVLTPDNVTPHGSILLGSSHASASISGTSPTLARGHLPVQPVTPASLGGVCGNCSKHDTTVAIRCVGPDSHMMLCQLCFNMVEPCRLQNSPSTSRSGSSNDSRCSVSTRSSWTPVLDSAGNPDGHHAPPPTEVSTRTPWAPVLDPADLLDGWHGTPQSGFNQSRAGPALVAAISRTAPRLPVDKNNVIQTQCFPFEHYMDRVPSLALQLDDLENGDGQCLEEAL